MGRKWAELPIGKQYGRLTVIGASFMEKKNGRRLRVVPVKCNCEQGTEFTVIAQNLINPNRGTRACHLHRGEAVRTAHTEHGLTKHPLHGVWTGMHNRCYNSNSSHYQWYGARNIGIDERWRGKGMFPAFYEWAITHGYKPGLHIHRKDNDADYSPENCEWTSAKTNNRNKGNNLQITAFGKCMLLSEWIEQGHCKVGVTTLHKRLKAGWTPEEAMSTPSRGRRNMPEKAELKSRQVLDWNAVLNAEKPLHQDAIDVPLDLHYDYFTVLGEAVRWPTGTSGRKTIQVPVLCRCGNEQMVPRSKLINRTTKSCGCYKTHLLVAFNTKHSGSSSVLYSRWQTMKNRCYNPKVISYPDYGGRNIHVCDEWLGGFESFRDWAETNGFSEELELDRIDTDGDYTPNNCRWVRPQANQRNRRDNRPVVAWGEEKLLIQWAEDCRCRVGYATLLHRLDAGWVPEDAISVPPGENP